MEDTLTKPARTADAVEGEVAAALDGAAHARTDAQVQVQASPAAERTLDAWRPDDSPGALLAEFVALFNTDTRHDMATVSVPLGSADPAAVAAYVARAVRDGVIDDARIAGERLRLSASRATFWQNPRPWLKASASGGMPLRYTITNGHRHPVRPPSPAGEIYARYMPQVGMTFSLRTVDIDADAQLFSDWMNLDRVAHFWDQRGTLDEHAAYLAERLADPHMHPMIGYFDDTPFGYFEFYWAKEDRLAPFYDAHDYDRGLHLLIGDSRFQSAGKLHAWWSGVLHYMFVDEPRTQRLVGEPRVDHVRHIAYMHRLGFYTLKEFDFPHKRAALTVMERETFFDSFRLP
ncbi:acetyl CoA--N6-hydroxylysine acetyl transferase [Burkholderia sp. Nafp2/4-1b]|uniref:GNAT family N-acetyltransferase n=1 Tax=Burkholderia sp. Nafp2/4-1b TaxID=2116686 RepID=UPI000EF93F76|nr:GNAT family N-acetyltransferase [Burkholderia sp. Nafp2/4-1b]RKT99634.1 acetyl CoA--N6-hydroxylysine acetyl transferase [Burkholderia sp. Nafp2/4-1b]